MKPLVVEMQAFGPFAGRQVIDFSQLGHKTFFLIHGPTGAGKTSILDAMCFALFGDSSGGERQGHQMRSHHADPATLTELRFDFALGDQRYRVMRIPEQTRPSRRGGGETVQAQRAELHRLEGADAAEQPLATGWRKVTEAVVQLLGFESRQFRQVIMLPQGQFFEFLKSSSQEREKILQALFGTEMYRRIEERLARQAQELAADAAVVMTRRDTLLQQAQVADEVALHQRLQEWAGQVATLQGAETAADQAARAAEAQLSAARQLADRFGELDKAEAALALLRAQEADHARQRAACARARSAATVTPYATAATQAKALAAGDAQTLASHQAQAQAAVQEAATAEAALAIQQQQAPASEELQRRLVRLDELQAKVQALDAAGAQLTAAQVQATQATTARAAADKAREQATDQQAAATKAWQDHQLLAARLDGLRARVNLLTSQTAKATALAKAQTDAATAHRTLQTQTTALDAARAAELQARAARDAVHAAWVVGQAARLAEALVVDQACPVCGSAHHPAPAHHGAGPLGTAPVRDETLEAAETALRNTEAAHRLAQTQHADTAGQLQRLQQRMEELRSDLGDAAASAAALKLSAQAAQKELSAAEAASAGLAALQAKVEAAGQALAQAQTRATQAEAQAQATLAKLQQSQAILAERAKDVPADLASQDKLDAARAQAAAQLGGIRKAAEAAATRATLANEALAAARARVQAVQESLVRLTEQHTIAERERDARLQAAGFGDLPAYEAARLNDAQLATAEAALLRHETDLAAATQRMARAQGDVAGAQRPDLPTLATAHEQAKAALLAASNAVRDALAAQQAVTALAAALGELAVEYQRLQGRYAVVKKVADLANGVGGQRMSFQRYVLSTLLEEVLAATTVRLQVMSKGRYELRRAAAPADRRAAAGLDLEAFDHYTGTTRPVTTLSGGESFLTSLALALGLSDVVQAYAGGIRLDAIFVDEGFGTLDTEALDFAIRALKDLQQAGRMVGIISHVNELREWIDARLEVKASAAGSVAAFVV